VTKPFAWSFSSLNQYDTCPYQYYRIRVKKDVKDEMGEAALWGNEVHKHLDKRIGKKVPLPARFKQYEKFAKPFDTAKGLVVSEQQLCINENMEPTSWFGKDAWCRGIIDVAVLRESTGRGMAGDWKTGKRKVDSDQLKLFAGLMFIHYPYLTQVDTAFFWLKENKVDKETFYREDIPDIWRHFAKKVHKIKLSYEKDKWPKNPSGLCKGWCKVTDCPFWEPFKT
jgi:hypothetical protein